MQSQLSPLADLGTLYQSGVDLFYTDGDGNPIRITQSGGVIGTPGSISGLVSPASATYVPISQTFIWQSDVNTAANMDMGSIILRNLTVSSFGLTVMPPTLGSNYSITLPTLPVSQKIMTLDAAGNMSAPYVVDNSTIEIQANVIQVKDLGIITVKLADNAVTNLKLADNAVDTRNIVDGSVTRAKLNLGSFTAPTIQKFTSGSGTYTTPAGVTYIKVKMVGAGGGGGGDSNTQGANGTDSTFGSSLLTCAHGVGGKDNANTGQGGAGGTATINSPAYGLALSGGVGGSSTVSAIGEDTPGGAGGSNALAGGATSSNHAATANTGGGGSGGDTVTGSRGGGGGGAGGYIEAFIPTPSATYAYVVGAGGAGNAGGGNGAAGLIYIEEYYQ